MGVTYCSRAKGMQKEMGIAVVSRVFPGEQRGDLALSCLLLCPYKGVKALKCHVSLLDVTIFCPWLTLSLAKWELGGWLKWQRRWEESSNFFLASLLNWKLWGLLFYFFHVEWSIRGPRLNTNKKKKVYSKIKSHFQWKIQLFSNKIKWLEFYSLMFIFFQKEPNHQNH